MPCSSSCLIRLWFDQSSWSVLLVQSSNLIMYSELYSPLLKSLPRLNQCFFRTYSPSFLNLSFSFQLTMLFNSNISLSSKTIKQSSDLTMELLHLDLDTRYSQQLVRVDPSTEDLFMTAIFSIKKSRNSSLNAVNHSNEAPLKHIVQAYNALFSLTN